MARLERELTAVLSIEVPDEEIVRRLSGRRICTKNGHVYHVEFDPPKHEGFCDQDGSPLIQRDDDKPETVQHRLDVFHNQTKSLLIPTTRSAACCGPSTARARRRRCTATSGRRLPH